MLHMTDGDLVELSFNTQKRLVNSYYGSIIGDDFSHNLMTLLGRLKTIHDPLSGDQADQASG